MINPSLSGLIEHEIKILAHVRREPDHKNNNFGCMCQAKSAFVVGEDLTTQAVGLASGLT